MIVKQIPYGISNYKTIISEGYAYVDKTMYISLLEQYGHYLLFVRPQRFGKSLFTSMLGYYYDIAEKDNFDLLFSNMDIGRNPTKNKNAYYVLKFDFSSIEMDSYEIMLESFAKKMHNMLFQFCARYNLDITLEMGSPGEQLSHLFTQFTACQQRGLVNSDAKIYVIIDEYDNFFANEFIDFLPGNKHNNPKRLNNTASENRFLRVWYEVLNEGTKTLVDRIFITGVFPIALESGFKISQNLSLDSEFNEMMGFTRAEVEQLIEETISDEVPVDFMDTLTYNYSGYSFSEDGRERVFHTTLVLYYLQHYHQKHKPPRNLLDQHTFNYYRELEDLFTSNKPQEKIDLVHELVFENKYTTAIFKNEFFSGQKFNEESFKSLLFYLGLLTIKERELGWLRLKIPNYAMTELYFPYCLKSMTGYSHFF